MDKDDSDYDNDCDSDDDEYVNACQKDIHKDGGFFCENCKNKKDRWKAYYIDTSLQTIREAVMTSNSKLKENEKWKEDTPYDTRQLVIKEFISAYKSATTNKIRGNIKEFKMGFKSRKDTKQSFNIDKRSIDKNLNLFKRKKVGKLRTRNKMKRWIKRNIDNIDADCKIVSYGRQQYYLLLSVKKDKKNNSDDIPFDVASLDPGVRTFQTMYSPNGIIGKFGEDICKDKLLPIGKKIDQLDSVAKKSNSCKTRLNIRRRQSLLRTKIKNIVNNLHWETINFLCKNFKTIIISYFNIKSMTNKLTRNINNKAVRNMLSLSHYAFKMKLISRAEINGNEIIFLDESYTSKTCGKCGTLKENLRGNKIFKCDSCGLKIDRDINGSRNIMIRLLS